MKNIVILLQLFWFLAPFRDIGRCCLSSRLLQCCPSNSLYNSDYIWKNGNKKFWKLLFYLISEKKSFYIKLMIFLYQPWFRGWCWQQSVWSLSNSLDPEASGNSGSLLVVVRSWVLVVKWIPCVFCKNGSNFWVCLLDFYLQFFILKTLSLKILKSWSFNRNGWKCYDQKGFLGHFLGHTISKK